MDFNFGLDAGAKAQQVSSVHISAAGGVMVQQDRGRLDFISPTHVMFGFASNADGSVTVTMPGFLSAPQRNGASIKLDGRLAEQLRTGTTSGYETMSVSAARVLKTSADDDGTCGINCMNLENAPGQIEADSGNLHVGGSYLLVIA